MISVFRNFYIIKETICKKQRTCEANPESENNSLAFTCCVKTVSLNHFKLVWVVVLHMTVKASCEPTYKNEEICCFHVESYFEPTVKN